MKINVRNAAMDDLPFVASLYAEAVAGGHFGKPQLGILDMLQHWLVNNCITREATRQDGEQLVETVPIKFLVADLRGARAGFLITSPKTADIADIIEIYLLGVSKAVRRQGVAMSLIECGERQYLASAQFYARCYPKSTWAISLFKRKGYSLESVSPNSCIHHFRKGPSTE